MKIVSPHKLAINYRKREIRGKNSLFSLEFKTQRFTHKRYYLTGFIIMERLIMIITDY